MDELLSAETEPPVYPMSNAGPLELISSVVDCRDQICPKPILMIRKALADASLDHILEIIVNEDVSKQNVLKYCWNYGQPVLKSYANGPDFHIFVKKSPEKKVDSPMPVVGPCGTRWD
jgi:TusA-related sulfurtransferase